MLQLPDVTLVCVDTRDIQLALAAIGRCTAQVRFGQVLFFTDAAAVAAPPPAGVEIVDVEVNSVQAYSEFMLRGLAAHLATSHALVAQWDGFVRDASCWDAAFLDYDYVGAPWAGQPPQRAVGNGGFSLRSRRLLQALQDPRVDLVHPEDIAICHVNRDYLERAHGVRIAPIELARGFSYERVPPPRPTFGFHGLYNFARELEPAALQRLLEAMPDRLTRGLDAHDLCRTLIAAGRLDSAGVLLDKRWRLGMRDRRTLRLAWHLRVARWRQARHDAAAAGER